MIISSNRIDLSGKCTIDRYLSNNNLSVYNIVNVNTDSAVISERACTRFKNIISVQAVNAKFIGNYAFDNCENLRKIEFGDKLNMIGIGAFRDCGIEKFNLPISVNVIGENAFNVLNKDRISVYIGGVNYKNIFNAEQQGIILGYNSRYNVYLCKVEYIFDLIYHAENSEKFNIKEFVEYVKTNMHYIFNKWCVTELQSFDKYVANCNNLHELLINIDAELVNMLADEISKKQNDISEYWLSQIL